MSATIEVCKVQSYIAVDDLKFYPQNPRTIKPERLAELKRSIRSKGFYQPILVWKKNGIVLAGNHRLLAAKELINEGFTFKTQDGKHKNVLPVVIEDVSEEVAKAILFESNNTYAEWIEDKLRQALEDAESSGFDLSAFGFTQEYVDSILKGAEKDAEALLNGSNSELDESERFDPLTDEDAIPEDDAPIVIKRGDTWILGKHRLHCGDSTSKDDVSALMAGEKADMVFTDPPYNISSHASRVANVEAVRKLRPNSYGKLTDAEWDKNFDIKSVLPQIAKNLNKDSSCYIATSHFLLPDILAWMKKDFDYSNVCVWSKPNPMPSLAKRHWTWGHELIAYATKGKHVFNFPEDGHAHSVWTINKSAKCDLHPTMKPIAVPEHAILHSSNPDQVVLDLFGGSGSTLIACENTGRRCYMMEIDEKYVQTIIKRWQKATGKEAIHAETGDTFNSLQSF